MKINRDAVKIYFINYTVMHNNENILDITYGFFDILIDFMERRWRTYLRSVLNLYRDNINIFVLNIMNYTSMNDFERNMNKLLDYIYNIFKMYRIKEFYL